MSDPEVKLALNQVQRYQTCQTLLRRPEGIEVLAAGLDEIAAFRRSSGRDERQAVVYGVG
jgi:hypothetical protein